MKRTHQILQVRELFLFDAFIIHILSGQAASMGRHSFLITSIKNNTYSNTNSLFELVMILMIDVGGRFTSGVENVLFFYLL